ncbi:EamA family transporter [Mannheimia haemolytica]|nr:EamA family transporter [Mannheimia haemolytica]UQX79968.1 EamA family transporter [Mannheimia haemolytica]
MFKKYFGEIILFLVTFIAAAGGFFSKHALVGLPPIGFMGGRFILASLILLPFSYRELYRLDKVQVKYSVITGLTYGIYTIFWVLGLAFSTVFGEGAFLVSLTHCIKWALLSFCGERHLSFFLRQYDFSGVISVWGVIFCVK